MVEAPIRYATSPSPFVPSVLVHQGDCLDVLRAIPAASIDAIVTDPPYGLSDVSSHDTIQALTAWASGDRKRVPDGRGFMGHDWDRFVPPPAVWDECFRVLKPGGHMAVFAGTRTEDLMGLSIRLAGFERRDTITWLYATGFPKGLDISKAIDKAAGAERDQGNHKCLTCSRWTFSDTPCTCPKNNKPATDAAKKWDGWNVALKPASEPIIIVRKPFSGTVVANVLKHGTGGINIDTCRVEAFGSQLANKYFSLRTSPPRKNTIFGADKRARSDGNLEPHINGRWPANLVISHAATPDGGNLCVDKCVEGCAVRVLDEQSDWTTHGFSDSSGTSRFYNVFRYQAKAPKSERPIIDGKSHSTVKPLALIEHLVKLLAPPYGIVLDPFAGSGTTGQAAHNLGFDSILIENNPEYLPFINQRLKKITLKGVS